VCWAILKCNPDKTFASSITLFGAIGHSLREPTFMLGEATSQEEFLKFLRGLKHAKVDPQSKPYLVMDSKYQRRLNPFLPFFIITDAGAHRSEHVRRELYQNWIPFFQPGYSCLFNR
jgi:hypothetical protein